MILRAHSPKSHDQKPTRGRQVTQADFVMFVCDLEMEEEELPHCGTNGGRTVPPGC